MTDRRAALRFWLVLLLLFVAVRLPTALLHELHNDESTFMRYSQLMHEDWRANRHLTMDGRFYGQYLPPLQFWMGAAALRVLPGPMALRLLALAFGAAGFLSWVWLAQAAGGRRAAVGAAALLLASPYHALFDALFMQEAFVYGLGGLYLALVFAGLRRWWDGRPALLPLGCAAVAGALGMLVKESFLVFLAAGPPLAGLALALRGERVRDRVPRLLAALGFTAGTAAAAVLAARLAVPQAYRAVQAGNTRLGEILSLREVLALPLSSWLHNAGFLVTVLVEGANLLPLLLPLAWWCGLAATGRSTRLRPVAGWLLATWLVTLLPVVLLLKVSYVRHNGMTTGLLAVLAGVLLADLWERGGAGRALAGAGVAAAALAAVWSFHVPLLRERFTAIAALETPESWATGAGISGMLDTLAALPRGVLLLDPEWGFPRSAVELFAGRYPQLELETLTLPLLVNMGASREPGNPGTDRADEMIAAIRADGLGLYVLLETDPEEPRPWLRRLLDDPRWCGTRQVLPKRWRGAEIGPSQRVLCTAGG